MNCRHMHYNWFRLGVNRDAKQNKHKKQETQLPDKPEAELNLKCCEELANKRRPSL